MPIAQIWKVPKKPANQAKGYIWPYIPRFVLIRTHYLLFFFLIFIWCVFLFFTTMLIINRPIVARAVPKPYELGTCSFERIFTSLNVSHVTCHVSHIMCHMSHIACHMSHFFWTWANEFDSIRNINRKKGVEGVNKNSCFNTIDFWFNDDIKCCLKTGSNISFYWSNNNR